MALKVIDLAKSGIHATHVRVPMLKEPLEFFTNFFCEN